MIHNHKFTPVLFEAHNVTQAQIDADFMREMGAGITLLGLYLREKGFDAYKAGEGTLVIINYDLLTPAALSLEVKQ